MSLTVKSIVEKTYENWSNAIKGKVGNNYSMKNSGTVSKFPYASLYFQGLPGDTYTLTGEEGTVIPTVQIDIYTNGQRGLTQAYEIDELSHGVMLKMGYRRAYGPEPDQNVDPSINRLISRYSRVIVYADSL